jgi:O-antigen/teichoic acid export membrane protein
VESPGSGRGPAPPGGPGSSPAGAPLETDDEHTGLDLRRFLSGGLLWAGAGLVVAVLLALAVNGLAARLLSTDDLAAFLLLVSLGQTLGVLVELGLPPLVTRELAGRGGHAGRVFLSSAWVLVGIAAVLAVGLGWLAGRPLAAWLTDQDAVVRLAPWIGLVVAGRGLERLAGDSFRGLHDIRAATVFGSVWTQALAAAGLLVLLLAGTSDGSLAVLVYGIAGLTVAPVTLWLLRAHLARPALRLARARAMLRESWPLIGHRGLFLLLQQAPLWVVAASLPAGPTAEFGLALRVVSVISFPLLIVNQVVPPVVARYWESGQLRRLERALRVTATVAAVPAVVVLGAFIFAGRTLLTLGFGSSYAGAAGVLAVLSVGYLVNVLAGSCGPVLTQTGHQRTLLAITAAATTGMLTLAAAVAEPSGAIGVAAVAAGGLVVQNVAMVLAVRRLVGIRTYVGPGAVSEAWGIARERLRG